jgi:uncharacterized protein (TIGR03545 family)
MENTHLSLFRGILSFDSLTIADADNPMKNLIETGEANIEISIAELTRKRVRIDNMSLENVLWNSSRSSDGSIEKKGSDPDSGSAGSSLVSLEDFDYQGLIDEQKDNLKSLELISETNTRATDLSSRWSNQLESNKEDLNLLRKKVNEVISIDLKGIDTVDKAADTAGRIKVVYVEVEQMKRNLEVASRNFQSDRSQLLTFKSSLTSNLEADLTYLNSLLDFSTGNIQSIGSDMAEQYIRNRWNTYYEYGLKALKVYKRFENKEKEESREKKGLNRSKGRFISFPTPDNPDFLIQRTFVSGGSPEQGELSMEIRSVSSDPDKVSQPLTYKADLINGSQKIQIDGLVDGRSEALMIFEMNFLSPGNPFELEQGIPSLFIENISSSADLKGRSHILKDEKVMSSQLNITLKDLQIIQSQSDNLLASTVADFFSEAGSIEMEGEVVMGLDGIKSVSMESDFDRVLADGLGGYLKDLDSNITDELSQALVGYLGPELAENELLFMSLDTLGLESLEQISSLEEMEGSLNRKAKEVEEKAESLVQAEAGKILDSVKKTIKIPGF